MHRAALDPARLAARPPWTHVEIVEDVGSTNAAVRGRPAGTVLAAEHQSAGRGRLDRRWSAPPRSGLAVSAVVRADVPAAGRPWLPLLAGCALHDAVRATTGLAPALKWPNDLLLDGRKTAGILVELDGPHAVVGIGVNVSLTEDELPVPTATSLLLAGAPGVDRTDLLAALLERLGARHAAWYAAGGDADACGLAADYRAACATLGTAVRVDTGTGAVEGTAVGVDASGRLLVAPPGGPAVALAAGDVVHARALP